MALCCREPRRHDGARLQLDQVLRAAVPAYAASHRLPPTTGRRSTRCCAVIPRSWAVISIAARTVARSTLSRTVAATAIARAVSEQAQTRWLEAECQASCPFLTSMSSLLCRTYSTHSLAKTSANSTSCSLIQPAPRCSSSASASKRRSASPLCCIPGARRCSIITISIALSLAAGFHSTPKSGRARASITFSRCARSRRCLGPSSATA